MSRERRPVSQARPPLPLPSGGGRRQHRLPPRCRRRPPVGGTGGATGRQASSVIRGGRCSCARPLRVQRRGEEKTGWSDKERGCNQGANKRLKSCSREKVQVPGAVRRNNQA